MSKNKTNEIKGKERIRQNKKGMTEVLAIRRKLREYEKQRGRKQAVSEACGGWGRQVEIRGGKVVCFILLFPLLCYKASQRHCRNCVARESGSDRGLF